MLALWCCLPSVGCTMLAMFAVFGASVMLHWPLSCCLYHVTVMPPVGAVQCWYWYAAPWLLHCLWSTPCYLSCCHAALWLSRYIIIIIFGCCLCPMAVILPCCCYMTLELLYCPVAAVLSLVAAKLPQFLSCCSVAVIRPCSWHPLLLGGYPVAASVLWQWCCLTGILGP